MDVFPDERSMSKSQVSRLCADIDERVNVCLIRPLEGASQLSGGLQQGIWSAMTCPHL